MSDKEFNAIKTGDVVRADDAAYKVLGRDDYGCILGHNLREDCLAHEEYRTLDKYDIDEAVRKDDPVLFAGVGI